MRPENVVDDQDIAIVGMTGRFPGAPDLATFWANLCGGVESIRPLTDTELDSLGVDPAARKDPHYVKAAAVLDGMDKFDAAFFGFTPREAELMDPQHRVFLECCWEALERAGYAPGAIKGAVGVFAGATTNTYLLYNLVSNPELLGALDQVQIDVSNGADFLSTRVAYKLDLRGPSYTVQSACSTSLVATHVACQSLLNEECDLALAGGVAIHVKHPEGYRFLPGGIFSPDGHCRAFDAKAEGTVFGSGAGVVVLKRLRDAVRDRDFIHAIIKGSAINNDGSGKVGYTAPSVEGQAAVIREAIGAAGVEPETIGYVETHGTGTQLGDPIELRALSKAFRPRGGGNRPARGPCLIGSLKTNIGHLAGAAGVASLIKAVLTVENRRIPPSLHFQTPNPEFDFANNPFQVNSALTDWPRPGNSPRRAGVSSFGVGGTNAHVVLEEAPAPAASGPSRPAQLLLLSAKTPAALDAATENLRRHLADHPEQSLADVAFTLQVGRQPMAQRRILVCRDREDALRLLESRDAQRVWTGAPAAQDRPVAFLFPGQGAQHVDMLKGLYASEPVFREHLDTCARHLQPLLGLDLRTVLYPPPERAEEATRQLEQTALTQPALFAVEYSLAQLWISWGVRPKAMLGHSIGEYVAACLAGVLSLPDALALVATRGQLMQSLPPGSMLAVLQPEDELRPHLSADVSVAAINGPALTVVSGPSPAIDALQAELTGRGVGTQRLHTSHAFHSAMMDPILARFTERVRQVKLSPPKIPYISNLTGTWIDAAQATDPSYWATHLRQAVRFADGLATLVQQPHQALLEVGPGQSLSRLARPQVGQAGAVVVASARHPREQTDDLEVLLGAVGQLWLNGASILWSGFYAQEQRRRLPLPTYPFERQRYWIDARPLGAAPPPQATADKKSDSADWFYVPSWRRAPAPRPAQTSAEARRGWLVFADEHGVADALAARLAQVGQQAVRVVPGADLGRRADGAYTLNPQKREDYAGLLKALQAEGQPFDGVVHLWSLTPGPLSLADALPSGFDSLLSLARALGEAGRAEPLRWWVASTGIFKVEGADVASPEKATLLGPALVVPQEYPNIRCHVLDVAGGAALDTARAADHLFAELQAAAPEPVVAYRGRQRWVQTFEATSLAADVAPALALEDGAAYLVTEGLAGIGWALTHHLARTHRARLALVEPPDFPPREQWSAWLATHGAGDPVSGRIQNAQALEATGAEVLILSADLADEARMREAVAEATARFGRLDGALHAASGLRGASFEPIQEADLDRAARVLTAQAQSLRALEQALPAEGLDFCLLASSLSSVLGGLGQATYAAASLYMDAFAERRAEASPYPWISVDWDAWRLEDAVTPLSPALARFALLPAEGIEATRRILAYAPGPRVAVSTGELSLRKQRPLEAQAPADAKQAALPSHPRPALPTPFVEPRTDLERDIARVCQQVLGIEQIGIDDNFFDLGGNSLIAVQATLQLKKALQVDVPAATLYQRPTVRTLAELLAQGEDEATRQRAEKLAKRKEELGRRNQWLHRKQR